MCGITGFFTQNQFDSFSRCLPAATASLAHRGPDDTGIYVHPPTGVGLGHRRLSILDLSPAGHQPMACDDTDVRIVYNGEVYNFRVLRKELEQSGHRFHSDSDTEVILASYLEWGTACLNRFVGMFALAIWDGRSRQLLLARDQIGIKPLYYFHHDGNLIFASELKGILAYPEVPRILDTEALGLFLHYGYIPSPRSIFLHIHKLLPGHCLVGGADTFQIHRWAGEMETPDRMTEEDESECLDRLQDILSRAVSDQMVSDVPLGALLSGGIDSSLVAAIMQRVSARPVRTFSIGFGESEFNEASWAAAIAEYLGTSHTELYVTSQDALSLIPRLPEIYDEPFADASGVPSFLVSQLTRAHVTVALSGDGGDEQFCGYTRYWATRSMSAWMHRLPASLRRRLGLYLAQIPAGNVDRLHRAIHPMLPARLQPANFLDKWQKLIAQLGQSDIESLYRMSVCLWDRDRIGQLTGRYPKTSTFDQVFEKTRNQPVLSRLMQVDRHTYLPDAMLVKVDRASMAAGLEIRVPLLDQRVVGYAAGIPEKFLYHRGMGKIILRKLLARFVPPALFERPKMGFAIPVSQWLRGELKPMLLDYLSADRLKLEGLFDVALAQSVIAEHLSGRQNHPHRLWALLMWEMWREKWL